MIPAALSQVSLDNNMVLGKNEQATEETIQQFREESLWTIVPSFAAAFSSVVLLLSRRMCALYLLSSHWSLTSIDVFMCNPITLAIVILHRSLCPIIIGTRISNS